MYLSSHEVANLSGLLGCQLRQNSLLECLNSMS